MYYFAQKKGRKCDELHKGSDHPYKGFIRRQRNLPNKPRRIKAGVELGDRYKAPDGHVYLIEEMHGGLVAINMSSLQTEFIGDIDWSRMEKMHD